MDTLRAQRDGMSAMETAHLESLGPAPPDLEEFYHTLTTSSGWETRVKVWRRRQPAACTSRPLILLFHGGGFCVGSIEQTTREGRELALAYDAVVVSATYRLAPEHKFPVFINDSIDVAEWMSEHAAETFGADLSRSGGFVVGGFSAGAQAAAMVASEVRGREWRHKPSGLFLGIPVLLAKDIVPEKYREMWTSRQNSFESMTPEMLDLMHEMQGSDARSPLFSPVNSPLGLTGMPRTYVQVGDEDPLRDDGIVFAKALEETGVEVRWHSYDGLGHSGYTIGWVEATAPAMLKQNTMEAFRWLLRRG